MVGSKQKYLAIQVQLEFCNKTNDFLHLELVYAVVSLCGRQCSAEKGSWMLNGRVTKHLFKKLLRHPPDLHQSQRLSLFRNLIDRTSNLFCSFCVSAWKFTTNSFVNLIIIVRDNL